MRVLDQKSKLPNFLSRVKLAAKMVLLRDKIATMITAVT